MALLLGWLGIGAFWNFGRTGFVLSSVILAAVVLEIGHGYASRNPLWLQKMRARRPWKRFATLFVKLSLLTLVFMMLLGGSFGLWEHLHLLDFDQIAPSSEAFEARYNGKEYDLLRQLDAFKDSIPAVELTHVGRVGWKASVRLSVTFVIAAGVLLFFFIKKSAEEDGALAGRPRRGGWGAAFSFSGIFLASLFYAWKTKVALQNQFSSGGSDSSASGQTVVVNANVNQVANALARWAAGQGCESTWDSWGLKTVPNGELIAKVEVFEAWKGAPSERWRMTARGLEWVFPHVAVQVIGSEKPPQSKVTIFLSQEVTWSFIQGDSASQKWEAVGNSLTGALKRASDFKPDKGNLAMPNDVIHPAIGSQWLGLCVVFIAMVLWILETLRYRYGTQL